ncbi:MAG: restriction endonuclease [Nitrososphaerota archaeon]|nr:restriction endonuclease [Nitrososphaerota archaeon]
MNINQAKGVLFEEIIKMLLEKNDYEECKVDGEQVDNKGRVRGRGGWHQIDALGRWRFTIPFVYPIRLLCEAKCLDEPVGLPVVRNFVGVLKDVSENYFIEDRQDIDRTMLSKRYTDCGAIFSASGFTPEAQKYAYAQNVFLVSYENNPIIEEFRKIIEDIAKTISLKDISKKRLSMWFKEALTNDYQKDLDKYVMDKEKFENSLKRLRYVFHDVQTSVVGVATGVYPIHLLSRDKIPEELFIKTDGADFRVKYQN